MAISPFLRNSDNRNQWKTNHSRHPRIVISLKLLILCQSHFKFDPHETDTCIWFPLSQRMVNHIFFDMAVRLSTLMPIRFHVFWRYLLSLLLSLYTRKYFSIAVSSTFPGRRYVSVTRLLPYSAQFSSCCKVLLWFQRVNELNTVIPWCLCMILLGIKYVMFGSCHPILVFDRMW